jgi:hypothetical protein
LPNSAAVILLSVDGCQDIPALRAPQRQPFVSVVSRANCEHELEDDVIAFRADIWHGARPSIDGFCLPRHASRSRNHGAIADMGLLRGLRQVEAEKSPSQRTIVAFGPERQLSSWAALEILTQFVDVSVSGWSQACAYRAAMESRGRCSRTFRSPRDRALAITCVS